MPENNELVMAIERGDREVFESFKVNNRVQLAVIQPAKSRRVAKKKVAAAVEVVED
jgi:hypothetical protein